MCLNVNFHNILTSVYTYSALLKQKQRIVMYIFSEFPEHCAYDTRVVRRSINAYDSQVVRSSVMLSLFAETDAACP